MDARDVLGRSDAACAELIHHPRPVRGRVERYKIHKPRAAVIGIVRMRRRHLLDIGQQSVVALGRREPQLENAVELLELADADGRLDVCPAVVEPEADVVEPPPAFVRASLIAEAAQQTPLVLGVSRYDAAFPSRDLLV